MPGNLMTGLPVSRLLILGLQLQDGIAREIILLGWRCPLGILPTIRHTWPWIWAVHDRLGRDQQSKDVRNMHGIMALQQNSAAVTNLLCLQTQKQKPVWKVALFTFQQHQHVQPLLTCLRQVMYLFCFRFLRWEIWVRLLNWILKETRLHVQLWLVFLLQLSIPQWDIFVGPDESYVSAYD